MQFRMQLVMFRCLENGCGPADPDQSNRLRVARTDGLSLTNGMLRHEDSNAANRAAQISRVVES